MTGQGVDVHQAMIATQKADTVLRDGAGGPEQGRRGLSAGYADAVLVSRMNETFQARRIHREQDIMDGNQHLTTPAGGKAWNSG